MLPPKQQFVKIPKDVFEKVLAGLSAIENRSADPDMSKYAYALGQSQMQAALIKIDLTVYGKECS